MNFSRCKDEYPTSTNLVLIISKVCVKGCIQSWNQPWLPFSVIEESIAINWSLHGCMKTLYKACNKKNYRVQKILGHTVCLVCLKETICDKISFITDFHKLSSTPRETHRLVAKHWWWGAIFMEKKIKKISSVINNRHEIYNNAKNVILIAAFFIDDADVPLAFKCPMTHEVRSSIFVRFYTVTTYLIIFPKLRYRNASH